MKHRVVVVGGCRTPFVKAGGVFKNNTALDLGKYVVDSLVKRLNLSGDQIDELAYGTVLLDPRLTNAARELVLRSETLPNTIPAHFVSNNCITGLVAITKITEGIRSGRIQCGIAAGAESMSNPTLTLSPKGESAWKRLGFARKRLDMFKAAFGLLKSPRCNFVPKAPPVKEHSTGLSMGESCEVMAKEWGIKREDQDQWAFESHMKAYSNLEQLKEEIVALNDIEQDNIIRPKTTLERLAKLKPAFDKESGTLTAGNSTTFTDGASAVCLCTPEFAEQMGLPILAEITQIEFSAIDPHDGLLMAPVTAVDKLGDTSADVYEIHEAFAAQVLCNLKALDEGWEKYPLNTSHNIPREKINIMGGSLAIGHPFAATGGRLVTTMANHIQRGAKTGIISVCAAGAMGCAMKMQQYEK